mmetsp:Transcript_3480/g.9526  ORF Transcript_3480/g.9526 Transcript_3480/m.9526 type:complete len:82 (-) Transcript_3480:1267-1512(-)
MKRPYMLAHVRGGGEELAAVGARELLGAEVDHGHVRGEMRLLRKRGATRLALPRLDSEVCRVVMPIEVELPQKLVPALFAH